MGRLLLAAGSVHQFPAAVDLAAFASVLHSEDLQHGQRVEGTAIADPFAG